MWFLSVVDKKEYTLERVLRPRVIPFMDYSDQWH